MFVFKKGDLVCWKKGWEMGDLRVGLVTDLLTNGFGVYTYEVLWDHKHVLTIRSNEITKIVYDDYSRRQVND